LPGLVAAKIGAQNVVLCDNPKVDKWLPLIRETISLNNMIADRIRIEFLDWYDAQSIDELIKKYFPSNIDIILGSDIFFHKKGEKKKCFFFVLNKILILDFETIVALLEKLFSYGHSSLKFIGTIERRR
jgi:predicted nicotinamide N-methyase